MTAVKFFLVGEGKTELGGRAGDPVYRQEEPVGVLEALLRRVGGGRVEVIGVREWKSYRKLTLGRGDDRVVIRAAVDAAEAGADALALVRDADNDDARHSTVEASLTQAREAHPSLGIVGGVAIRKVEAWVLAALGQHRADELSCAKLDDRIAENGLNPKSCEDFVPVLDTCDLAKARRNSDSLDRWLTRAEAVLKA